MGKVVMLKITVFLIVTF